MRITEDIESTQQLSAYNTLIEAKVTNLGLLQHLKAKCPRHMGGRYIHQHNAFLCTM